MREAIELPRICRTIETQNPCFIGDDFLIQVDVFRKFGEKSRCVERVRYECVLAGGLVRGMDKAVFHPARNAHHITGLGVEATPVGSVEIGLR
ncbi:MAG: hypothetical protein JNM86_05270 [Phycisphaerae bacterium]|nr:hypothetical protein [Phycisphaerae bacterium]MBN8598077.1 hypothetical protein [Planctomycetota bacterium]